MYTQEQASDSHWKGLWDWNHFTERNLFQMQSFHSFLDLHNYYIGAHTNGGVVSVDTFEAAQDRLRRELERADRLQSIQCLVDMDSAWGAFASDMLTYLSEECAHVALSVFGNDYPYASTTSSKGLLHDRTKQRARTCLNVVSSLLALWEHAHLVVPIAMSPDTLPFTRFSAWNLNRSDRCGLSQLVATSLMASQFNVGNPYIPSPYKFCELAVQAPIRQPETVSARIAKRRTASIPLVEDQHSLLPCVREHKSAQSFGWRRTFISGIDMKHMQSRNMQEFNITWSLDPLLLPQDWLPQYSGAIDTIAEYKVSESIGFYLQDLGAQMQTLDRRIVHEYVQNGMESDRLAELREELATHGELYHSIK
uniref:Myotubularinlike protein putative n=1 Tax=Albugo laibachii Nc14 TaxID=890382 RepID=F0W7L4_9STRA|nr:myotubularinlike protein putative [Albugo laibachii Nc14]|eukprot:CCA17115.1 myotubularinlike protein putative [Albugo laibachii Nc14]